MVWISGAIFFSINYLIAFLIVNAIWPEFILSWNFTALSGKLCLGIPIKEHLFSILYGGSMGTCMAYLFDICVKISRPGWFHQKKVQTRG